MTDPLSFTVTDKGIAVDPPTAPTQRPALSLPRPIKNRDREKQDELRRPQAAVLFRALREAGESGLSWKECWALSADEEFVVGPIVVWMRFHGCEVEARYDAVAGETRFYLQP